MTKKHGAAFAAAWEEASHASGQMLEAFAEAGVITWPENDAARGWYMNLEDDILEGTFAAVRDAVAEAFVRVGNEVIERERERRRKARRG